MIGAGEGGGMGRVYVDMAADLFHYGHVAFLRRARELGDFLIVGVHSDETLASYKRWPILSMLERIGAPTKSLGDSTGMLPNLG